MYLETYSPISLHDHQWGFQPGIPQGLAWCWDHYYLSMTRNMSPYLMVV
jgi:hypothetical protein